MFLPLPLHWHKTKTTFQLDKLLGNGLEWLQTNMKSGVTIPAMVASSSGGKSTMKLCNWITEMTLNQEERYISTFN